MTSSFSRVPSKSMWNTSARFSNAFLTTIFMSDLRNVSFMWPKIQMDPQKVQAVVDWPSPLSVKEVQRFLSFANFFANSSWTLSTVAAPLSGLTKGNTAFAGELKQSSSWTNWKDVLLLHLFLFSQTQIFPSHRWGWCLDTTSCALVHSFPTALQRLRGIIMWGI